MKTTFLLGKYKSEEHAACIEQIPNNGRMNRVFEEMGVPYAPRSDPSAEADKEKSGAKASSVSKEKSSGKASSGGKTMIKVAARKEKSGPVKKNVRKESSVTIDGANKKRLRIDEYNYQG